MSRFDRPRQTPPSASLGRGIVAPPADTPGLRDGAAGGRDGTPSRPGTSGAGAPRGAGAKAPAPAPLGADRAAALAAVGAMLDAVAVQLVAARQAAVALSGYRLADRADDLRADLHDVRAMLWPGDVAAPVIAAVEAECGLPPGMVLSADKHQPVVRARWLAIRALRDRGLSIPQIARAVGRDTTTVQHGLRQTAALMAGAAGGEDA